MDAVLKLPGQLKDRTLPDLLGEIAKVQDVAGRVLLDFSGITFAEPFGALVAAEAIRRMRQIRELRELETACLAIGLTVPPHSVACSYLSHVGFFKHLGYEHGNAPGEASGSDRYLPITALTSAEFGVRIPSKELAEAIRAKTLELAGMVLDPEEARILLSYCFTEVVRNVFEHAGSPTCFLMAQKYSTDQVEIAVVDAGCGVLASLSEAYIGLDGALALEKAVKPGISRTRNAETSLNSGFGLYVLSELGRQHGAFSLWSGDHQLQVWKNQWTAGQSVDPRPMFRGTAVRLRVRTDEAQYFPNWLRSIVAEGEKNLPPDAIQSSGSSKSGDGLW